MSFCDLDTMRRLAHKYKWIKKDFLNNYLRVKISREQLSGKYYYVNSAEKVIEVRADSEIKGEPRTTGVFIVSESHTRFLAGQDGYNTGARYSDNKKLPDDDKVIYIGMLSNTKFIYYYRLRSGNFIALPNVMPLESYIDRGGNDYTLINDSGQYETNAMGDTGIYLNTFKKLSSRKHMSVIRYDNIIIVDSYNSDDSRHMYIFQIIREISYDDVIEVYGNK